MYVLAFYSLKPVAKVSSGINFMEKGRTGEGDLQVSFTGTHQIDKGEIKALYFCPSKIRVTSGKQADKKKKIIL